MLHIIQDPRSPPALQQAFGNNAKANANLVTFCIYCYIYIYPRFQLIIHSICRFLTVIKTLVQVKLIKDGGSSEVGIWCSVAVPSIWWLVLANPKRKNEEEMFSSTYKLNWMTTLQCKAKQSNINVVMQANRCIILHVCVYYIPIKTLTANK